MTTKMANFRVPIRACFHAMNEGCRLPEDIEKLVYSCPASSYLYAKNVLKSRIPEQHEKIFANGICFKQNYRPYETKKMSSKQEVDTSTWGTLLNSSVYKYTISVKNNTNPFNGLQYSFDLSGGSLRNDYVSVAYLYAKNLIQGRLPEDIEKIAFRDHPISCYLYVQDVIKEKPPEYLENIIAKNSVSLLAYAQNIIKGKISESLEKNFSPSDALAYSLLVSKQRLPKELEEYILVKEASVASDYGMKVVKGRLQEVLHNFVLMKSMEKNANKKIIEYLTFCDEVENLDKSWDFFKTCMGKFTDSFYQLNYFDYEFEENSLKCSEKGFSEPLFVVQKVKPNKIIILTKYDGSAVYDFDMHKLNKNKNYVENCFPISGDFQQVIYDLVAQCAQLLLKNKLKEIL